MKTITMNKEFCKEIISNKVYEIRTRFNLTQDDMGEMLNVDQSIISSIETGRRHIQIHELYLIAINLKVNIDYLFSLDDEKLNKKAFNMHKENLKNI